jgi:hypothetical protein
MCLVEAEKSDDTLVRISYHVVRFYFTVSVDISCHRCNEIESIKTFAKLSQSHICNMLSISSLCKI